MDEGLVVCKFGGSSIVDEDDVKRIGGIVLDDRRRRVVVVSAPGKRGDYNRKVTDMLIELANVRDDRTAGLLIQDIIERYSLLNPNMHINDLELTLRERTEAKVSITGRDDGYAIYLDQLKAFGEYGCGKRVAQKFGLNWVFVDAKELFLVTRDCGNARILPESRERIRKNLGEVLGTRDAIAVVPGFYGYTECGEIATFSRGGSDLTGAYIAASLEADVYENFTDVDGVMSANPDIVRDAKKLDRITFNEMRDLSYSGFGVLHHQAVLPCQEQGVPIHIRNTFFPKNEGTYVVSQRITDPNKPVTGVAYKNGFCSFSISRSGLDDQLGVYSSLLNVFGERQIQVPIPSNGVDDITVMFNGNGLPGIDALGNIECMLRKVATDPYTGKQPNISFRDNLGLMVVAGAGLARRIGRVDADIRSLLDKNSIEVHVSSQGEQKRCLMYGIDEENSRRAVNLVYDEFLR